MTNEERLHKFDEMKQKTISRILGDKNIYDIKSYNQSIHIHEIKKQRERKLKERLREQPSLNCKDFFEYQAKKLQSGGRIVQYIDETFDEIPSPIK